jgi:hypothetical protein
VPKDISYDFGKGKISLHANSNTTDATGANYDITIGGSSNNSFNDNDGPIIKPFMNDTNFINGGITSANSTLVVDLSDDNGINTSGTSVGHNITAYLDGSNEPINLNSFFEGASNNYKRGFVKYPLRNLSPGKHSIKVKAWDVLNNSNTATVDFVVSDGNASDISRVLNYPNPFTDYTEFWFEHNHPGELLYVTVNIYSISGKAVRSIRKSFVSEGSQVREKVTWDGRDEYGNKIGRGTYIYQIHYKTASGNTAQKMQKLVIL